MNIFNKIQIGLYRLDIRLVIVVGTLVRLLLIPFTAHPFDVNEWYVYGASKTLSDINFNGVNFMRPLWLYLILLQSYFYRFISTFTGWIATPIEHISPMFRPYYGIEWIPGPLFNTIIKFPLLLADVGISLILYRLVRDHSSPTTAKKVFTLYYLNPFSIWITSGWGQSDSLSVFFTVLSLYYILNSHVFRSLFTLFIASLFKMYAIAFFFPVLMYLIIKEKYYSVFKYLLFIASIMLLYLMLNNTQMQPSLIRIIMNNLFPNEPVKDVFGYGLTYWSWSLIFPLNYTVWIPISMSILTLLLTYVLFYVLKNRTENPLKHIIIISTLFFIPFYLSLNYVAETRVLLLLPFLTLMVGENIISFQLYTYISCFAFLYTQKNFPFYLLPIATFNEKILRPLFKLSAPFRHISGDAIMPSLLGGTLLSILGTLFSLSLLLVFFKAKKQLIHAPKISETC
tara:strand:- start:2859 stop:4223 length:1365 start_codon:yes stop_codon:yes gene_type:complete